MEIKISTCLISIFLQLLCFILSNDLSTNSVVCSPFPLNTGQLGAHGPSAKHKKKHKKRRKSGHRRKKSRSRSRGRGRNRGRSRGRKDNDFGDSENGRFGGNQRQNRGRPVRNRSDVGEEKEDGERVNIHISNRDQSVEGPDRKKIEKSREKKNNRDPSEDESGSEESDDNAPVVEVTVPTVPKSSKKGRR